MDSNKENFQKKTPYPFILKSLAKKRTDRNSILSPDQSPNPSSLTRIRSSDSKYTVYSMESRVVRDCEDILRKVKKQQMLYESYKIVSADRKQQLRLQNTIRLLQQSIKKKDKTIVKLHRIVKQLETDFHSVVRSAMKGRNTQVFEEYGFQIPKQQKILRSSKLQQSTYQLNWNQKQKSTNRHSSNIQPKIIKPISQIAIQTDQYFNQNIIQNQKIISNDISTTSTQQMQNQRLNKLIESYKQQCFLKQKQMMYQIKYSSQRIQQLQNEIRTLKSISKSK